jgi:hypothetical protein
MRTSHYGDSSLIHRISKFVLSSSLKSIRCQRNLCWRMTWFTEILVARGKRGAPLQAPLIGHWIGTKLKSSN